MDLKEKVKTFLISERGIYCYKVMPFGLKNAGVTYQGMTIMLSPNIIHKKMEVYVNDMIVKSAIREGHFEAQKKFLHKIVKYKLKLNPSKCVFGVILENPLGHQISQRRIEVDLDKVKAMSMENNTKSYISILFIIYN